MNGASPGLMPVALTLSRYSAGKGNRDGQAAFLYKLRRSRIASTDPQSGELLARIAALEGRVIGLQKVCDERQEVIVGLDRAARERLDLIHRLDAEVKRLTW